MRSKKRLIACFTSLCLLGWLSTVASADVAPGDVIDKSNWEKVQGLLPESVLDWVKMGDIVINVGELNYDPKEYMNPVAKASMEANKGKYDLDANNQFVDKATGEFPTYIEGIPFPDIDEKDPRAAAKLMYNRFYDGYATGPMLLPFTGDWIGRSTGFERQVLCSWEQYPLDGYPGHKTEKNKEGVERFALIRVLAPFDIKGTNILLMRYRGEKPDTTLAYVPAIRRVRRMSPANRSDAFIGSDCCVDDAWCFDGKIVAFDWELVGKQEALFPFLDTKVQLLEKNKYGGWSTSKSIKQIVYGHEKEGWQGAPWQPTNLVWAKRQAYVIKMVPKDPYYNYGPHYLWLDTEVHVMTFWKIIYDRAEKYWKTVWYSWQAYKSTDDTYRQVIAGSMQCVEDRTNHATVIGFPEPDRVWNFGWKLDPNDYTLGGFQKACK